MYLWTHRLTNTDVVSVVTTTRPFTKTSSSTAKGSGEKGGLSRGLVARGGNLLHRGPPFSYYFWVLEALPYIFGGLRLGWMQ